MGRAKFFLKDPSATKETLVLLIYRFNYKTLKYSTRERIAPNHWDFKKQRPIISKKYPLNDHINKQLEKYDYYITDLVDELNRNKIPLSKDLLKRHLNKEFREIDESFQQEKNNGIINYLTDFITDCKEGRILTKKNKVYKNWTIKGFTTLSFHLNNYEKSRNKKLRFEDITIDFYDDFINYFFSKNRATNTIGKHVKNLKVIMKTSLDKGLHNNTEFQREKFKVVSEETVAIYLNEDEFKKIYNYDLSNNMRLEKVRDLFIVAARTALRYADLVNLNENNFITNNKGYFIKVRTQKTDEYVMVPLKIEVIEIFRKYNGQIPRNISNQKMNEYLKEIGELIGINDKIETVITKGGLEVKKTKYKWQLITTHTARRSAATNLFLAGFPTLSIMKITGHKTEKAFLKYIRMSQEDNAYKMADDPYFKTDFQKMNKPFLKVV